MQAGKGPAEKWVLIIFADSTIIGVIFFYVRRIVVT